MRRLAYLLFALMTLSPARAIEPPPENTAPLPGPEQPDVPAPVESGENMEPDITITRRGKETVEEYRINGKLYMVKIKPSIGPPYYMIDSDGDGNLDVRKSDVTREMSLPSWVLFSW
ncbi:MAG: DUF2782 domain-containing protein [Gammaproteobacteria bacterium]|nr:DUF2782 domain-containing protein [Gammaproteobacteria bacterium]